MQQILQADFSELIQFAELIGNASHETRNLLAMKKKLEFPELSIIDNTTAALEGQIREIIAILQSKNQGECLSLKLRFLSIYRALQFLIKSLIDFKDLDYKPLEDKYQQELLDNLLGQQEMIQIIDKRINDLILNTGIPNLNSYQQTNQQNSNSSSSNSQNSNLKELYQYYNKKFGFSEKPNYKGKEGNIENLIQYTKDICNRAHHIQSQVCPLQAVDYCKEQADQIINHAGQIENQARFMLSTFECHKNLQQLKRVIGNRSLGMKNQIQMINTQIQILGSKQQHNIAFYLQEVLSWICEAQTVYEQFSNGPRQQIIFNF